MKKNPLRIDEYCDNRWQELDKLDPRLIFDREESMDEIKKELQDKYGDVNINIQTGEYTDIPEEDLAKLKKAE